MINLIKMICKICKTNQAEIALKSHKIALCKNDYISWIEKRVEKAIKQFKMFSKQDKILVGVSGGKDSLVIFHILKKLGYDVKGVFIDLGIPFYSQKSKEKVIKFAQKEGADIKIIDVKDEFKYSVIEIAQRLKRPTCSVCGQIKRYMLNKVAQEFDVIVTGHNLDDEIATLFGNLLSWQVGYLQRQFPVLKEEQSLKRKVKPLIFLTEREISAYAFFEEIDYLIEKCPFSKGATSIFYKKIFNQIEQEMPGTKLRFLKLFLKNKKIFGKPQKIDLKPCKICGYLTTAEICSIR